MKAWSEMTSAERTEACVELAENHDMSYLQIANLYKTTRNVIAGLLNRYKAKGGKLVNRRGTSAFSRDAKQRKQKAKAALVAARQHPVARRVQIKVVKRAVTPARVATPIRVSRPVVPPPDGLNILDLNDRVCRWPLGEGPYSFCGAPTVLSASGWKVYCGVHNAAAYIPREKKPSKRSR